MTGASGGRGGGGWPRNRVLAKALAQTFAQSRLGSVAAAGGRPLRCLLMLSGGLDSVALLANLLAETPHHVHAHHIEIDNYEQRTRAENEALTKVVAYCKHHYRPFDYTTSGSQFPLGKGGGYDLTLSLFVAARVCSALGGQIDAVITGHRDTHFEILSEGAAVFHACFINKRTHPEWLRPLTKMPKRDIYESIPPKLATLSWSCRRPVHGEGGAYSACGACHSCRELAAIGVGGDAATTEPTTPTESKP
jgi:7-cyano-7-deazaguanine synthase in queuosine biosynthesis